MIADAAQSPALPFLQQVDSLVPPKLYLRQLLTEDSNSESTVGALSSRSSEVIVPPSNPSNFWSRSGLWVELVHSLVEEQLKELPERKDNFIKKMFNFITRRDAKMSRLDKVSILMHCFHSYLLKYDLQRDQIDQILFTDILKLKKS